MDENTTVTSFDIGDVEAAFAKSEAVVKGSIETTRQEHFYEETNIALVVPVGEDNEYKVYASTPNILMTQQFVSWNTIFYIRSEYHMNRRANKNMITRWPCSLASPSTGFT